MLDLDQRISLYWSHQKLIPKPPSSEAVHSLDCDEFHEEELEDTEEIFQLLSDVVDDWKLKLELIVAEGLKKMRKSTKEKKTMMKYLPGNKLVGPAKEAILVDWKSEFVKTLGEFSSVK